MILTRDVILREIAAGRIVIDPFVEDQIGPASIDLHLGDEIRVMEGGPAVIEVTEAADYRAVTKVRPLDKPYLLKPGETIHGITRERLKHRLRRAPGSGADAAMQGVQKLPASARIVVEPGASDDLGAMLTWDVGQT